MPKPARLACIRSRAQHHSFKLTRSTRDKLRHVLFEEGAQFWDVKRMPAMRPNSTGIVNVERKTSSPSKVPGGTRRGGNLHGE